MGAGNNNKAGNVLLIGNIGSIFSDADVLTEKGCQVYADILDGLEAAAKKSFRAIAVVTSGASAKSVSALKSLRKVCRDAKIILLVQMYEEPRAMKLVGLTSNGSKIADDYLICPINFSRLASCISYLEEGNSGITQQLPVESRNVVELRRPAVGDTDVDEKIKCLEKLATDDDLTRLKNRRYVFEFTRQIIERAKKEDSWVTLLIFDVDNFKHYNDIYGHSAGDEILKQAAVLMRRCCRSHDVVGRIGGDEFIVIFWDNRPHKSSRTGTERRSAKSEHPDKALFIAERFRREFNKAELHMLGPEGKGVLTISGGLASFPRDGSTAQELFERADEALLEAKRSGKNIIYLVGHPENGITNI